MHADAAHEVFGRHFRVLDFHVEIPALVEDAGVEKLVLPLPW